MGWRPVHCAEEHEHNPAPCLRYVKSGAQTRIVTALYPSNNGECAISKIEISDDFDSEEIKVIFRDGSETVVKESDYPAFSDSDEKFV